MTTTGAGSGAARAGPARAPARLRRWLGTADGRAVSVLVVVPLVLFVVPALFGYPAIAGDNTIQNFPLRALTGEVVRQGHLPLWNPFIWSGSPLLGGLMCAPRPACRTLACSLSATCRASAAWS